MALIFHSSPSLLFPKEPHLHFHLHNPLPNFPTNKPTLQFLIKSHQFLIKSQSSSSSSTEPPKPTTTQSTDGPKSAPKNPPPKTPTSTPQGFGSKAKNAVGTKNKQRRGRERASVIRRTPVGKPQGFVEPKQGAQAAEEEQSVGENAFLLTWLGLGSAILIEGIALAASGFLPDEWDKFLVKYVYPVFTPTVFLFIAGTVTYGVLKYLQNEKLKKQQ